ncbi:MAG: bacteriocin system transporter, ATP-binding protein, partial [Gemmatimonadetes bacterium]|nr:bacteriocin system transporter, ATP-binding protein [Gemmatimonadota bacterium]
ARVRPGRRVAWVRHEGGASLLFGRPELRLDGGWVPLSRAAWLEVEPGAALHVEQGAPLVASGEAWTALPRLHALALACCAANAEQALEAERRRLGVKSAASRGAFSGAFASLASTLAPTNGPRMRLRVADDGVAPDTLLAAARLVGEAAGVVIRRAPAQEGASAPREPLAALCRASRVHARKVILREGWWREDGGPMLGALTEGRRPVALLPARGGYVLHDPDARAEQPVTAALAETLEPMAHAFYRPFGDAAVGVRDLIRFGIRGCGRDLWTVLLMSTGVGLLSLLTPIATGIVFNDIIPGAQRPQLLQLTGILLVIAVSSALLSVLSGIALVRIDGKMGSATQAAVWDRLLALPMPFFRPYSAGELATRAMGIDSIRLALSGATVTAMLGGVFSLFHFGLLFHYSPSLAWWATLLIGLAVGATALSSWLQLRHQRAIKEVESRLAGSVLQFLSSISKLRVAGAEVQAFALWARGFSRQRQLQYRARTVGNVLTSFNAGFTVAAWVLIYAMALPMLTAAEGVPATLRTGDFLAFMASFGTCLGGMLQACGALMGTLAVIPTYEQARPILVTPPEVDTAKSDPGTLTGDIELQRLYFRYQADGPPVLKDLTLRIRAGEFVAFVGPSGSGKSTTLRLLLGFEAPDSGAVYYDGQDLAGLDVQAVRRQVGVVLQSGRLMSGDVFTNITGSSSATVEDAWEAARAAGFDEDVKAMPMGMHTMISEGGSTLSGGQRQRLMIARAIVQKPRILFFDEATSALDNRTQSIVSASLEKLQATRIVIAHRLSTVVNADHIYVVDGGRIVQDGTYEELIAQPGLFADLAKRQLA